MPIPVAPPIRQLMPNQYYSRSPISQPFQWFALPIRHRVNQISALSFLSISSLVFLQHSLSDLSHKLPPNRQQPPFGACNGANIFSKIIQSPPQSVSGFQYFTNQYSRLSRCVHLRGFYHRQGHTSDDSRVSINSKRLFQNV